MSSSREHRGESRQERLVGTDRVGCGLKDLVCLNENHGRVLSKEVPSDLCLERWLGCLHGELTAGAEEPASGSRLALALMRDADSSC